MARATLVRFENGRDVMHSSVTRLRKTFEAAGVEFSGNFTVTYRPNRKAEATPSAVLEPPPPPSKRSPKPTR